MNNKNLVTEEYKSLIEEYPEAFEETQMSDELKAIVLKAEAKIASMDPRIFEKDISESDPKFYRFIKTHAYVEPPPELKENVMKSLFGNKQDNKQNEKEKTTILSDLLRLIPPMTFPQVRLIFATGATTIALVLVIAGVYIYYQYTNTKNINQNGLISNEQTPKITTTNSLTTPTPSIDPNIVENISNSKNIDNKQDKINNQSIPLNNTKENNKLADSRKYKRPEPPKNIDKERDTIAVVRKPKVTDDTNNNSEKNITLANLVNVHVLPLEIENEESDPLDLDISKELTSAIANNKKWKLSEKSGAEASFKKQATDRGLVLITNEGEILWEDKNYIENYKQDRNYIKSIVKSLTKHHH